MTKFRVTATRWEKGWELDIEGVGVTQSKSLRDADEMVRDYVRLESGSDVARDAIIEFEFHVDGLEDEVQAVREELDRLAREQRELALASRAVASKLKHAGLTGSDAAKVMGVSEQRFSQLLNA